MGEIILSTEDLAKLLEEAAQRGAKSALAAIGLHDEQAARDINDVRSLLSAWREARSAAWKTAAQLITTGVLVFIAGAVWVAFRQQVLK